MTWTLSAVAAIHFAVVCAGAGVVITASESLWLWSRGHYGAGGIWSWTIAREAYSQRAAAVLTPLMSDRTILSLLVARLLAALAIPLVYGQGFGAIVPLTVLIVIHCVMQLRSRWGGEGSDQMTTLVLVAGLVTDLSPDRTIITTSAALFIGAQITMSYLASGCAKLFGPLWRSGQALPRIMNHYTYGHAPFAQLLMRYPLVGTVMSRCVIAFQITFWVFYVLPMPYALIYPMSGAMFHIGIAYFMRLNLFIPAFLGTYPCLFFTYQCVHGLLFG